MQPPAPCPRTRRAPLQPPSRRSVRGCNERYARRTTCRMATSSATTISIPHCPGPARAVPPRCWCRLSNRWVVLPRGVRHQGVAAVVAQGAEAGAPRRLPFGPPRRTRVRPGPVVQSRQRTRLARVRRVREPVHRYAVQPHHRRAEALPALRRPWSRFAVRSRHRGRHGHDRPR